MGESHLDDIDRQILYLLQQDARNNTNAAISEKTGVSASTVGNRIKRLEVDGIVRGYHPEIDYDRAGFSLRVLFICTASIAERSELIEQTLDIQGVVNVRELMTGEENIHVEVVGRRNEDITRVATQIDDLGISISEEILVKNEYPQPASVFDTNETGQQ